MDDGWQPEKADAFAFLRWPFGQGGMDTTQQFLNLSQSIAKAVADWNNEVTQFAMLRVDRNSKMLNRLGQCKALPEILATQAEWGQEAFGDYTEQASRLAEINSKVIARLVGSVGDAGADSSPVRGLTKAPT